MIIDCHVYCLPDRLRSVNVNLPTRDSIVQEAIYRHPESELALQLASPEKIIASMKQASVDKSILVSFPWNTQDLCIENNEYNLAQVEAYNTHFGGAICSIQPNDKNWYQLATRWIDQGAIGLKTNPVWQGYELDTSWMDDILNFVAEKKIFIMIHIDQPTKKSPSSAAHLLNLCKRNPNAKILAAHMGGMLGAYTLMESTKEILKNVWFDTAISATLPMVKAYVDFGIQDKVTHGSDYPFNHCHDQVTVVNGIQALKLGKTIEANIFSNNFNKLIKK